MGNFLDSLANSWAGGGYYGTGDFDRRRAMADALMSLGTTLMGAGSSGSWMQAAPMLSQAIPNAVGTFRGSLEDASKRAVQLEDRQWQQEARQAQRDQIEEAKRQREEADAVKKKYQEISHNLLEEFHDTYGKVQDQPEWQTQPGKLESLRAAFENLRQVGDLTGDPRTIQSMEAIINDMKTFANSDEDRQRTTQQKITEAQQVEAGRNFQTPEQQAAYEAEVRDLNLRTARANLANANASREDRDAAEAFAVDLFKADPEKAKSELGVVGVTAQNKPIYAKYRMSSNTDEKDIKEKADQFGELIGVIKKGNDTSGQMFLDAIEKGVLFKKEGGGIGRSTLIALAKALEEPVPGTIEKARELVERVSTEQGRRREAARILGVGQVSAPKSEASTPTKEYASDVVISPDYRNPHPERGKTAVEEILIHRFMDRTGASRQQAELEVFARTRRPGA